MSNIRPNALVIIKRDNVILATKGEDKVTGKPFHRLLGGGIDFGELSLDTLKRELKEELNATIINTSFLCIIENIYEFNGNPGHEITFLFTGDLQEKILYTQESIKILDKEDTYAEWVPIADIKNGEIILYPEKAIDYL